MNDLRSRLTRLARNLWWSWHQDLDDVFRAIDLPLWRAVNHNPIAFLQDVPTSVLVDKEHDVHLISRVIRAEKALEAYLGSDSHWASWNAPGLSAAPVAYLSPEFALHESLPVYSGGLGVLAGDHLKSCSDLGVATYGVTLLYREGYFVQQIDADGNQREVYRDLDTNRTAISPVLAPDGTQLVVEIPVDGANVTIGVWQTDVGRCKLILLDPAHAPQGELAQTLRLYGGDRRTRILQEVVLGVGGYRALRALGVRPGVLHLNEGHCGFAILEAIAQHMHLTGLSFSEAAAEIGESVVFTTHTPVAAGHDSFAPDLALHFLRPLQEALRLSDHALLGLGRTNPDNHDEDFCMSVLALKLARRSNAVSSLHGLVSRRMWRGLWPERRVPDVPIGHITNGAHVDTWIANEIADLFSDYLGADWRMHQCAPDRWRRIDGLDELALWSLKLALKRRLFDFIARRHADRSGRLGMDLPLPTLQTDRLTIGFARRFASYKRGLLLFEDLPRTRALLTNPERPVQLLIAGKSHPADEGGRSILRRLYELSREPDLRDHVVVIEDHDMNVSRHLLEGCDLWLNAPRRPLEACGTSGMKAVFNCTLNCSTLDGWWDEAYDGENGFAFGGGLVHTDTAVHDRRDAESLLEVLESQVIPCFYDRNGQGVPQRWLRRVKHALKTLAWRYNSDRMVIDYAKRLYVPASRTSTAELPGAG